jgi:multiple sugar transport system permease protein
MRSLTMTPSPVRATPAPSLGERGRRVLPTVLLHAGLVLGALIVGGPLFWMAISSFKDETDILRFPPSLIPDPITLSNYILALTGEYSLIVGYVNSLKIAIISTVGTLFTSSLAAYALARLRFAGRDLLFGTLVATLMVPGQITLIPTYVLYHQLGWLNTHLPLIMPMILANAFGIFLLRQFIKSIPEELEDAARIDGANPFTIYLKIILPLIKPALAALAIFSFMQSWNGFLAPLIYLSSRELYTLPLMMSGLRSIGGGDATLMGPTMAAATIAVLPVVILYLAAQRYFIEGVMLTGMKG